MLIMIYCVKKLHFYGLRGVAQKWIKSYLENRKQFVSFNKCHSEILNVSCGVPQGSILGPKKLSKCCAIMYRASSLINKHGMHILYYSLFMPYIVYCAEVWGNTYATNIHCLVLLHKRVIS